ncbi:transcription initiation factor TFIID subunit 4-like [Pongo pygmaeus]|uniref:transcription initiation factor TFIID subunit 4-like n=1 Tax=Pongo pygmaeus TaxID=9600 RepID=UPI00300CEE05
MRSPYPGPPSAWRKRPMLPSSGGWPRCARSPRGGALSVRPTPSSFLSAVGTAPLKPVLCAGPAPGPAKTRVPREGPSRPWEPESQQGPSRASFSNTLRALLVLAVQTPDEFTPSFYGVGLQSLKEVKLASLTPGPLPTLTRPFLTVARCFGAAAESLCASLPVAGQPALLCAMRRWGARTSPSFKNTIPLTTLPVTGTSLTHSGSHVPRRGTALWRNTFQAHQLPPPIARRELLMSLLAVL